MPTPDDYSQVVVDLGKLALSGIKLFGANAHEFRLLPVLTEGELVLFETKHEIRLPHDYRDFLLQVGRGGAGPCYGLFELGHLDDGIDCVPWAEGDEFVGVLSKPFPFNEAWNDLSGAPDDSFILRDPDEYDRRLTEFEQDYCAPLDGAVPICYLGWGCWHWLAVTGPEAGNVWADERGNRKGLYPLCRHDADRVSFFAWYRDWLDQILGKIMKQDRNRSR
jgi:hypothetical protein